MIPLIGVSTYVADVHWGDWDRRAAVLPESYFELVAGAGGRPLLLPPATTGPDGPGTGAAEVIDVLDGLVLTGGGDVDPRAYGEEAEPEVGGIDLNRDASEQALLVAALEADMPVLAICRGCQVLNVYLGGTLYQHLPDVVGNLDHRSAPFRFGDVDVETVPGTVTADVFGSSTTVRCSHHRPSATWAAASSSPPAPATASWRRSSSRPPASSWPSSGIPKKGWIRDPSRRSSGRPGSTRSNGRYAPTPDPTDPVRPCNPHMRSWAVSGAAG